MKKKTFINFRIVTSLIITSTLFGCSTIDLFISDSKPESGVDLQKIKPVVPTNLAKSRYGNPKSYEFAGVTYKVLKSSNYYKEKGIASW